MQLVCCTMGILELDDFRCNFMSCKRNLLLPLMLLLYFGRAMHFSVCHWYLRTLQEFVTIRSLAHCHIYDPLFPRVLYPTSEKFTQHVPFGKAIFNIQIGVTDVN